MISAEVALAQSGIIHVIATDIATPTDNHFLPVTGRRGHGPPKISGQLARHHQCPFKFPLSVHRRSKAWTWLSPWRIVYSAIRRSGARARTPPHLSRSLARPQAHPSARPCFPGLMSMHHRTWACITRHRCPPSFLPFLRRTCQSFRFSA